MKKKVLFVLSVLFLLSLCCACSSDDESFASIEERIEQNQIDLTPEDRIDIKENGKNWKLIYRIKNEVQCVRLTLSYIFINIRPRIWKLTEKCLSLRHA